MNIREFIQDYANKMKYVQESLLEFFDNDDTNEKMIDLLIEDNSNETHQKIMNIILNLNFGQCFVDSSLLMYHSFQKLLKAKKKIMLLELFQKLFMIFILIRHLYFIQLFMVLKNFIIL